MVRRGQTLLREHEGVSSPKRRRTEVRAPFVSQSVTFLSSTFCRRQKESYGVLEIAALAGLW
jgi:hypothetical protein